MPSQTEIVIMTGIVIVAEMEIVIGTGTESLTMDGHQNGSGDVTMLY